MPATTTIPVEKNAQLNPAQSASRTRRSKGPGQWIRSLQGHGRRMGVLAVGVCVNRYVRRAFGHLNRRFGWVASVFVMYPATEQYAAAIAYRGTIARRKWRPFPAMFIRQEGRWCVVCAISAFEGEVRRAAPEKLQQLLTRAQKLQRELGAEYLTFSGILPGLMEKNDVPHDGREAETTVLVVADAIARVADEVGYPEDTPVILLGASGYIGTRLIAHLKGREVHGVDPRSENTRLPESLRGQRALLVNAASRRALKSHLPDLWEGLVLLNEVYPEPSRKELKELQRQSVPAFHVVGVKAAAFPPFPGSYRGGAPCCAAIPSPAMKALIREL